jgi:protein SCO1/2
MKSELRISLFAITALVLAACQPEHPKPRLLLPVLGEKQVAAKDTLYHKVQNFSLRNQEGNLVTERDVQGKIYVANFFFATCQSICPEMSTNLVKVQEAFRDDDSLLILSHSVNPLHDTVAVLASYAGRYGARSGKWHLLTGDKKQIYDLAKNSYLVNAIEDDGTPEGFLHSELFILVDPQGRLRGMYDGTDIAEVNRLLTDIQTLKQEVAAGDPESPHS